MFFFVFCFLRSWEEEIFSVLFLFCLSEDSIENIFTVYIYIYTHEWFVDYHKYLLNKIFEMSGKEVVANR